MKLLDLEKHYDTNQSEARYGHVKVQDNLVYSIPITIQPNKMYNIIWHQLFIF